MSDAIISFAEVENWVCLETGGGQYEMGGYSKVARVVVLVVVVWALFLRLQGSRLEKRLV